MVPLRTGNPSGDMAAIMARVRKMSDAQLADILAGKDVSVPQFAAMTEAMGRKRLRQAVDGQQALQQARQPSVKDQLLSEEAGLAALPAPNMSSIDMAGGGIVAFDEGGEVPRFQNRGLVLEPSLYTFGDVTTGYTPDPERERQRKIIEEEERIRAERKEGTKEFFRNLMKPNVVRMAESRGYNIPGMSREQAAPAVAAANLISTADQPGDFPMPSDIKAKQEPKKEPPKTGLAALTGGKGSPFKPAETEDFLGQYADIGKKMRGGISDIRKSKESDALLALSEALLGNPNLARAGSAAAGKLSQIGAQARREERELEKAATDFEFNLAKAREAAAQGKQDLAYKYAALAEDARYKTGILGVYGDRNKIMREQFDMVKIPQQLNSIYAKATDAIKAATATRPVKPDEFRRLVDEEFRKRATAAGLGDSIALFTPGTPAYNVVQSPKGAKSNIIDPFAEG